MNTTSPMASGSLKRKMHMLFCRKELTFSSLEHEITITDRQNAAGKLTYLYKGQNVGTVEVKLTADYIKEETGYNIEPEMKSVGKKSTDKEEKQRCLYM